MADTSSDEIKSLREYKAKMERRFELIPMVPKLFAKYVRGCAVCVAECHVRDGTVVPRSVARLLSRYPLSRTTAHTLFATLCADTAPPLRTDRSAGLQDFAPRART